MSGYIIANVQVTNPTQYEEYKKWSTAAMQATGAEVCVRGGKLEVLEGDWTPERIVILNSRPLKRPRRFTKCPSTSRPAKPAPAQPSCAWSWSKVCNRFYFSI